MNRLLTALILWLGAGGAALAQAPQDSVKLTISRANLQVIGQGLMELPYKTAAPVLNDLQVQLNAADRPPPPAPPPEVKPAEAPPAPGGDR